MEQIDAAWIKSRLTGRRGELADLAHAVGITPDKLAKILSGARRIQAIEAPRFAAFFEEGTGDSALLMVPVYDALTFDAESDAGRGDCFVAELDFPRSYLHTLTRAHHRDLAIIVVKGDSMVPTLVEDDVVMLDRTKRDPSYDGLFALRDGGAAIFVKRIGRASRAGRVSLISDNRTMYPTVERPVDELDILGRVIWKGGRL